ncbi:hypothetical protein AB1I63_07275 [Streptococcus pneumoniae]
MLHLKNAAVMDLTLEELMEVGGGQRVPVVGGGYAAVGSAAGAPTMNQYSSMYNGFGWWGNVPSSYYTRRDP